MLGPLPRSVPALRIPVAQTFINILLLSIVGTGVGLIVMLVCCSWLYLIVKQRKLIKLKEKFFTKNGGIILQQQLSGQENSTKTAKIFTTE